MQEETITHTELCERIKEILHLTAPSRIIDILGFILPDNTEVEYLGDSLYSWKQNEEI